MLDRGQTRVALERKEMQGENLSFNLPAREIQLAFFAPALAVCPRQSQSQSLF